MTVYGTGMPNFMGAGHGGHWNALAQAQGSAAQAAYHAYIGAAAGATSPGPQQADHASIEDAGIRAGEIIGWRAWRVEHGLLRAMFVGAQWLPRIPMVGDPRKSGVHAFKERKRVLFTYGGCEPFVVGRVALWGEVIEHEMGYRGEFGQVESLDEIYGAGEDVLTALRAEYLPITGGPREGAT